jgi:hypothetical protein
MLPHRFGCKKTPLSKVLAADSTARYFAIYE